MAFEDSFLDELDATPTSSKESMQILQDFRDDWEKENNNYQGWLSVGASPDDAAARTIVPVREKWNSFAPVMKSMINPSRSNPFSIFSTGSGELTRANKFTGSADVIKPGRDESIKRKADLVVSEIKAGDTAFRNGSMRATQRATWPQDRKALLAGLEQSPTSPQEPFEDAFEPRQQAPIAPPQPSRPSFGFMGAPQGFDEGVPFGDNSFEMPDPAQAVPQTAPDVSRRRKGQIYQTPKGPLRWSGTGWLKP